MRNLLGLILFALCIGCIPKDNNNPSPPSNNIEITSISPASAEAGVRTTFTISANYELVDLEQGEINIGFNVSQLDSYIIFASEIIKKGSGSDCNIRA